MRDGSAKLILATAALAGVWVVTYWMWPAPERTPPITFDEPSEISEPAPPMVTPEPQDPAPVVETAQSPDNAIGHAFEPAPQPEFPPVVPPEFDEHIVVEGESIWSIAQARWGDEHLGGVIARANPLVDPKRLRAGQRLLIPKDIRNIQGAQADAKTAPPKPEIIRYVVESNDTLSDIAKHFYGKASLWTRIRDANPDTVSPEGNVRVGVTLLIPPPPGESGNT